MKHFFLFLFLIVFPGCFASAQSSSVYDGMTPTGIGPGTPAGSYGLSGFEHYNPFSGAMSASISLHRIGGRGEAGFDLIWNLQTSWMAWKETSGSSPFIPVDPYPGSYPNQAPNAAGLGGAGGVYSRTGANFVACGSGFAPGSTVTTLIFAAGNGTQVNLVDNATNGGAFTIPNACTSQPNNWNAGRGTGFHSVDGSMLQFTADSPVLDWNPNGTAPGTSGRGRALVSGNLVFPNGLTYRIDNSNVSWIRDRNGNKIVLNYSNGPQYALDWYVSVLAPTQIVDSLNRTTSINYNNSSCGGCTTITYPGASGASRTIQIRLANLSSGLLRSGSVSQMGALFPEGFQTTYNFDPILASSIQFPDNSQYSFRYDSYGEIARVNLPTGGAVEYDFGDGHNGSRDGFEGTPTDSNPVMIYRRLQERREYAAGGSAMTARTHYSVGYPASETTDADIAYDAAGHTLTQTTHTMAGSPLDALTLTGTGCNAWNEGMEIQTDIGSPKITVQNALASQSGCMNNSQVATKTTTLTDTNQVSKSTYTYDQYNNIKDQKDYDWGTGNPGPLLRETQSIYLWAHNVQRYTAPSVNLVHAPYSQAVLDGSGKQYASTLWYYDDYSQNALQDVPGAARHDSGYGTAFVARGNLTYDVAGNVLSVQDQNGHASRLSYNDDGSNQYALPTSSTNALGQASSSRYDYNIAQPAYTVDPNGQRTNYSYSDPLDRLTQMQLPNGGTIAYSHPSVTQTVTQQDQGAAGYGALKARTLLDGFGRAIETDSYENASQYIATTTAYDALGRIVTATNPSRPGDGLNYATTYGYDSLGRETGLTMPDGTTATTTYTGNQTRVTDAAGHARVTIHDALGRTTQVVEDPGGLNYSTVYAYDPLGNLIQVTQGGQTRSFVYDSLSRLLQATNPESGTVSYAYDGVGNLVQKRDNRGITTQYGYDALNRPIQQTYSDGTPTVTYSYDAAGAANGKGQLTGISNSTSVISLTGFDAIGNVVASKQTTAGQTYAFSYGYNLAGSLVSETYPSGRVLHSAYDGANRPVNLGGTLNGVQSTYAAGVTYAPHGGLNVLPYGNGLTQHNWYDSRLRPQTLRSALNDQANNTYLQMNLTWNANNTLGSLSNNNGGPGYSNFLTFTQNFGYDNLNRLASATDTGGWSRSFQYDSHGNMWLSGNSGAPLPGIRRQRTCLPARTRSRARAMTERVIRRPSTETPWPTMRRTGLCA